MIILSTTIKIVALMSYIILALLTLRSGTEARVRRLFFIYLFGMIYWQFTSLMVNFSKNTQTALFWYNLILSGTGIYSILFFPFTLAFLGIKGQKKLTYFAYLACIFSAIIGLTGLAYRNVYIGQGGIYVPEFNNVAYLLVMVEAFFWAYGVFNLLRGFARERSPFQRNRMKYPLLGAILVVVGGVSNFTPLQDFPVDMSCNLINAVLIGYAVIKYRLLDIRVILTRSLFYSLLTGSVVGVYIVSVLALERILKSHFGYTSPLSDIVPILILTFVFLPLRNGIQNVIDRSFFREKYDHQKVLESFSRAVTSVFDLGELLNLILSTMVGTIKVDKAHIMLLNEERDKYIIERYHGLDESMISEVGFREDDILAQWLRREGLSLLREEMKIDPRFKTLLEESGVIFEKADISLVIPILLKDRLIGTLGLGEKLSGDMYSDEDLRFLTTIANQTATAIDNALVYKELAGEKEQLAVTLQSIGDGVITTDVEGKVVLINEVAEELTGWTEQEAISRPLDEVFYIINEETPEHSENPLRKVLEADGIIGFGNHTVLVARDGTERILSASGAPIRDTKGSVIGVVLAFRDVTEQVRAEEQVKASLREKEVLLKEIHHRVKNNLQVMSSLLYLQSKNIKDKETLEMFQESQSRVRSMALVHERLYQSQDLARIDFAEYIRNLANHLFRSYGVNTNVIKLKINVDDVPLGVDTAIPCGLIINELVSNCLKHAFHDDRVGEIRIELRADDGEFTLMVSDNGVGFPEDLDFRDTGSLGLQLVNMLVEQFEGTIELDRSAGTAFKIALTEPKWREGGNHGKGTDPDC